MRATDPDGAVLLDAHDPVLLDAHDALLLDLDGVVYVGAAPVPHAVDTLIAARAAGVATAYVTNNAARPPEAVAEHLRSFGLEVVAHDVVTSAQAGAREVAARVPAGSRVLVVGGPGVAAAVTARGLVPVLAAREAPAAVLMGYGPDVAWHDLAEAAYAVGAGALLVATNTDLTIPTAQGIAPGNGTLVAAVVSATGVHPLVAGKPHAPLMDESVERISSRCPLIVGDRLDTDIEAGHRTGIPSLLVLTGVTDVATLLAAAPDQRPTYLAADLRGLLAPRDSVALHPTSSEGTSSEGTSSEGMSSEGMSSEAAPLHDADGLAGLRRWCRRAWASADAGEGVLPGTAERAELEAAVAAALAR